LYCCVSCIISNNNNSSSFCMFSVDSKQSGNRGHAVTVAARMEI